MSRHRVEITFDDCVTARLICPNDGSCQPAMACASCGRSLDDSEVEPCYDCREAASDECWIKTWFDNCTADELLHGSVTVEIDAEWDGDTLVATLGDPRSAHQGEDQR